MPSPNASADRLCARLQQQVALSVVVDELAMDHLAHSASEMRRVGDPNAVEIEGLIRSHRVGLLRLRALLGAVEIDV